MTVSEIRDAFNGLLDAYRRSRGETAKYNASHIVKALRAHPWLSDQIPNDIREMAERDVATLP